MLAIDERHVFGGGVGDEFVALDLFGGLLAFRDVHRQNDDILDCAALVEVRLVTDAEPARAFARQQPIFIADMFARARPFDVGQRLLVGGRVHDLTDLLANDLFWRQAKQVGITPIDKAIAQGPGVDIVHHGGHIVGD